MDIVVRLQAAIQTVRLYPISSPLISFAIDALLLEFEAVLKNRDTYLVAESEYLSKHREIGKKVVIFNQETGERIGDFFGIPMIIIPDGGGCEPEATRRLSDFSLP